MATNRERHYRIIDGQLYARFVYTNGEGKRKEKHIKAESKTHAREIYEKLKREFGDHGQETIDAAHMIFRQLAEHYKKARLQPAEYKGDRKISGRRSYKAPLGYVTTLVSHFGAKRIKSISHSDIEHFKLERLKTPTPHGTERSIASVNRELEVLRAMLRFAVRSSWLIKTPFETGDTLISKSDEVQRTEVLSSPDEELLLAACIGRREHLRPLLICALDSAMRRGEMIQLKWSDVDLENRTIGVRAMTTKTARSRTVPISSRLYLELKRLYENSESDDELVFGISDNVKNAFASACRVADIQNFRLHDCRHTAITRMIQAGMTPMQVMKISGHTQMTTFVRYVNVDGDVVKRAAAAIDSFHEAYQQQRFQESQLIN